MMQDFSDFKCPWLDREEIRKAADDTRAKFWKENTFPIDIEYMIARRLNIHIESIKGLFHELSSNTFLSFDRSTIIVDDYAYMSGRFDGKIHFDLAHEVGHFVLHKEIYNDLNHRIKSIDDYLNFQNTAPDSSIWSFEYQASEFAGRLMVPLQELILEVEKRCHEVTENGLKKKYALNPEAFSSLISTDISDVFGVTFTNIDERVKRENIWPPKCLYA